MESIVIKSNKARAPSAKANARAGASFGGPNLKNDGRPMSGRSNSGRTNSKPIKSSKIDSMTSMLRRPKGASLADLCKVTGWQAHSVRGAMSATIKKKLGLKITSSKIDGVRFHRVTG
jgi:hypothetical protein